VTLDEVVAAGMPAGSSVWYCPLCNWVHAQPPPFAYAAPVNPAMVVGPHGPAFEALAELTREIEGEPLADWYAAADKVIEAHVSTHPLIEWIREVMRLREQLAAANTRGGEIVQHAPAILAALKLAEQNATTPELAAPYREALDATGWDKRL
jgi:hypothetical protein